LAQAKAGQSKAPELVRARVRAKVKLAVAGGAVAQGGRSERTVPLSAAKLPAWIAPVSGVLLAGGLMAGAVLWSRSSAPAPAQSEPVSSVVVVSPPPAASSPAAVVAPRQLLAAAVVVAQPGAAAPAPVTLPSAEHLRAEMRLLARAEAALRASDAKGALRVLAAHRAQYPEGQLRAEAEGLQLIAQCTLGREVAPQVSRYLQDSSNAVLQARLREACGVGK
jgi:hypothetical protein